MQLAYLVIVLMVAWSARPQDSVHAQSAGAPSPSSLDYNYFRDKVQPIFLAKRPGHGRCVSCHMREGGEAGANSYLAPFDPGKTTWTEEQSRQNFKAVSNLVVPGKPMSSRLLLHPLRFEANGDPYHMGGKHFDTALDPEFQTLYHWVKGEQGASTSGK